MKDQALFSSKDKSKKIKVSSAAILLGALRVNSSRAQYISRLVQAVFENCFTDLVTVYAHKPRKYNAVPDPTANAEASLRLGTSLAAFFPCHRLNYFTCF